MAKEVTCKIRENPQWKENKNVCCYFCGTTKGVEYFVDLPNVNGERVLTVDACGCCAMLMDGGKNENLL